MRTDLTHACGVCATRLGARVTRCPFCRRDTVPVAEVKRAGESGADRAGRWLRYLGLLLLLSVLGISLGAFYGGTVVALFTEEPLAGVVLAMMVGLGVLVLGAGIGILLVLTLPLVWLLLLWPLAALSRRAPPWSVSARSEPGHLPRGKVHRFVSRLRGARNTTEKRVGRATKIFAISFLVFGVLGAVVQAVTSRVRSEDLVLFGVSSVALWVLFYVASALGAAMLDPLLEWLLVDSEHDGGLEAAHWKRARAADDDQLARRFRLRGELHEGDARPAGEALRAPLSGTACVAYRLVGHAGGHVVDDAAVTHFDLRAKNTHHRVRATDVLLDLPPRRPERITSPGEDLRAFLEARGLPTGELVLAEALVVPGDHLAVWGKPSEESRETDGYREAATGASIGEPEDAPLVIARAERA